MRWRRRGSAGVVPDGALVLPDDLRALSSGVDARGRTAREVVDGLVEELVRSGSLDEGNGDVLDAVIDAWREQHLALLEAHRLREAGRHEQALAATAAALVAARSDVQTAREALDVAQQVLLRAQDRLLPPRTSRSGQSTPWRPVDEVEESVA